MNHDIASAVFDSRDEAQRAISELRAAGVRVDDISVIGRHGEESGEGVADRDDDDDANKSGAVKGALAGAGVGGLLGLAALAIPGVGPFAAAGAIAGAAMPEAAAIGAGLGAAAGGLSGLMTGHGVDEEDAAYYEDRVKQGGIFVSVRTDDSDISTETARDILYRSGGHSSRRSKMATA